MVGGFVGALLLSLAWYGVFIIILSQLKNTLLLSFYLASIPSMLNVEISILDDSANLKKLDCAIAHVVCHYSINHLAAPS